MERLEVAADRIYARRRGASRARGIAAGGFDLDLSAPFTFTPTVPSGSNRESKNRNLASMMKPLVLHSRRLVALLALAALSTLNPQFSTCSAQGTAFIYQGWLNSGANVADGNPR